MLRTRRTWIEVHALLTPFGWDLGLLALPVEVPRHAIKNFSFVVSLGIVDWAGVWAQASCTVLGNGIGIAVHASLIRYLTHNLHPQLLKVFVNSGSKSSPQILHSIVSLPVTS